MLPPDTAWFVCHTSEPFENRRTNQLAIWVVCVGVPKEAHVQSYWPRGANVSNGSLPLPVRKWLNPSFSHCVLEPDGLKEQVVHLYSSICCGNAALCQTIVTTCFRISVLLCWQEDQVVDRWHTVWWPSIRCCWTSPVGVPLWANACKEILSTGACHKILQYLRWKELYVQCWKNCNNTVYFDKWWLQ